MWVIYWAETGEEIDRTDNTIWRNQVIQDSLNDEKHTVYGFTPEYRWE